MIKEAIEKLNSIIEKSNNIELKEDIEEIIYNLEKSITLEDFLGWDEDQEYEYKNRIFKTRNNILYSRSMNESKFYETLLPISRLDDLRKASKFEPKKYYLKLKDFNFLNYTFLIYALRKDYLYLNFDKLKNEYYLNTKEQEEFYQTKFTEKEIENFHLPDGITLDMFDIIEINNV